MLLEENLYFSVQDQPATTISDLLLSLLIACGGNFNSAYFNYLDMDISECLYHFNIFINLKSIEKEQHNNEKLADWGLGLSPGDFDG